MTKKPQLFDTVALLQNVPDEGLERGNIGAIVEIYENGEAFEVEFVDTNGRTYGLLPLRADQLVIWIIRKGASLGAKLVFYSKSGSVSRNRATFTFMIGF
ncbi:MAG: DUF4926 domain-containing protein [Pyrinomonadaceae bacterium]